jgi:hypothetical protein
MGVCKVVRRIRLSTLLPSVSLLSKENVGASTSHNRMGLVLLLEMNLGGETIHGNKATIHT